MKPSGWTSNYTTTVVSNATTDKKPEEILSEEDAACEANAITGPKVKNDCQQYELEDPDYKCCFISFSIGSYNDSICQRIAYTAAAIGDMKFAFRHAKKVTIWLVQSKTIRKMTQLIIVIYFNTPKHLKTELIQ